MAGLTFGLGAGLASGLGVGLAVGLVAGLAGVPRDIAGAIDPRMVLARARLVMLVLTLGAGIGVGLAFGLMFGLGVRLTSGLTFGFVVGLAAGLSKTRWTSYVLARGWLAFRHQLPWSLMAFLADAHQRGVLRQAGATYQFRHLELQRRLATRS